MTTDAPPRVEPADRVEGHEQRLKGYSEVMVAYSAMFAVSLVLAERHGGDRGPVTVGDAAKAWSDVALVGVATFKLSRLLAKQTVTMPLRAPFTDDGGPAGTGERAARPKGSGLRRSVGELLSCPFCMDVWVATAATMGLRVAPRMTRPVLHTFAAVGVADVLHFLYVRWEQAVEHG